MFTKQDDTAFGLFFDPAGPAPALLVPGSNYGSGEGEAPYTGQVIAQLTAGGTLTLNLIDHKGHVTLLNKVEDGPHVVSASLIIEKLA